MKKKKQGYNRVVVYDSSSRDSDSVNNDADKDSSEEEDIPEDTGLRAEIGREIENLRNQTPMLTPQIGFSTVIATDATQPDQSGTRCVAKVQPPLQQWNMKLQVNQG